MNSVVKQDKCIEQAFRVDALEARFLLQSVSL